MLYITLFGLSGFETENSGVSFAMVFCCTLLFSVPAAFLFWLSFLVNTQHENLAGLLMRRGLLLSVCTALLVQLLPADLCNNHWLAVIMLAVISTVLSIALFYPVLKRFNRLEKGPA